MALILWCNNTSFLLRMRFSDYSQTVDWNQFPWKDLINAFHKVNKVTNSTVCLIRCEWCDPAAEVWTEETCSDRNSLRHAAHRPAGIMKEHSEKIRLMHLTNVMNYYKLYTVGFVLKEWRVDFILYPWAHRKEKQQRLQTHKL